MTLHRKLQIRTHPLRGHGVTTRGKRAATRAGSRSIVTGCKGLRRLMSNVQQVG
jgi:hypothetical protein